MPLNIRNEEVNRLATQLAERKRVTKTEAVKLALENELRRNPPKPDRESELEALLAEVRLIPRTGLEADKAFYDSLNDE